MYGQIWFSESHFNLFCFNQYLLLFYLYDRTEDESSIASSEDENGPLVENLSPIMSSDINEADSEESDFEESDFEEDDFTMKQHRLKRNFSILSSNSYSRKNPKNSKKTSTSDSDQSSNREFQSDNEPIIIDTLIVPKNESTSNENKIDTVHSKYPIQFFNSPSLTSVQVPNSILHSVETNQFRNQNSKNYYVQNSKIFKSNKCPMLFCNSKGNTNSAHKTHRRLFEYLF